MRSPNLKLSEGSSEPLILNFLQSHMRGNRGNRNVIARAITRATFASRFRSLRMRDRVTNVK